MTEERLKNAKEQYLENITNYITEFGSLVATVSIIGEQLDSTDERPAIIHIPISDEHMKDDNAKDLFVEKELPKLFKQIQKLAKPVAVAWAAEAWVRVASKQEEVDDYKKLPIQKEVVIINIETIDTQECTIYDIKRNGKKVNVAGELSDIIVLEKNEELGSAKGASGRFTGLFNKLTKI